MPPTSNNSPLLFALIGLTGSGRSSFVNAILGREAAAVGDEVESCTTEVALYDYLHHERGKIGIIDTPGFNEYSIKESRSDDKILKSIDAFLRDKQRLSGIIFLQDINSTNRVNWTTKQRCKTLFKKLCGTEPTMNVVVVTTFWDRLPTHDDGIRREAELQAEEGLLKDLNDGGNKFFRFGHFESGEHTPAGDPTFPTPREILDVLLEPLGRMSVEEQEQGRSNNNGHTVPADNSLAGSTAHQYQELQEETQRMRRALESITGSNRQDRERVDQIAERTDKRLEGLQEVNNKMQSGLTDLEERLTQFATKAELNTLEMRYEEDVRGIQTLVSELQEGSDKRHKDDQQRLEYLTKELERVRQDRAALDKECKELRSKLEGALDNRFKGLDTSLTQATESYTRTMKSLEASLVQAKDDHAETKKELDSLKVVHRKECEDLEELKAWRRDSQQEGFACNLQ